MGRRKGIRLIASFAICGWLNTAVGQTPIDSAYSQPAPYQGAQPTYLPPTNGYPSISGTTGSLPVPPDVIDDPPYAQQLAAPQPPSLDLIPYGVPQSAESPVVGSGAAEAAPVAPTAETVFEDSGAIVPYLAEPEVRWYQRPLGWFPTDGWTSSVEFGLNGAEGNSNSISYVAGGDASRVTDLYNFTFNLRYRRTSANGVETQNNALANFDLDRSIAESKFSTFIKTALLYDQFQAFDARVNVNSGISYRWASSERLSFITRFGAGASKEIGVVDDSWKPEALLGLEGKQQISKRNSLFVKVDYFPAWEDFSDYRLVTDTGWQIALNDADTFNLKLAATNWYDSTPLGRESQDINYTATLLYKF